MITNPRINLISPGRHFVYSVEFSTRLLLQSALPLESTFAFTFSLSSQKENLAGNNSLGTRWKQCPPYFLSMLENIYLFFFFRTFRCYSEPNFSFIWNLIYFSIDSNLEVNVKCNLVLS